jgi:hypothetical protein
MKTRLPLGVIAIPSGYRPALMVRDTVTPEPVLIMDTELDQVFSTYAVVPAGVSAILGGQLAHRDGRSARVGVGVDQRDRSPGRPAGRPGERLIRHPGVPRAGYGRARDSCRQAQHGSSGDHAISHPWIPSFRNLAAGHCDGKP